MHAVTNQRRYSASGYLSPIAQPTDSKPNWLRKTDLLIPTHDRNDKCQIWHEQWHPELRIMTVAKLCRLFTFVKVALNIFLLL